MTRRARRMCTLTLTLSFPLSLCAVALRLSRKLHGQILVRRVHGIVGLGPTSSTGLRAATRVVMASLETPENACGIGERFGGISSNSPTETWTVCGREGERRFRAQVWIASMQARITLGSPSLSGNPTGN